MMEQMKTTCNICRNDVNKCQGRAFCFQLSFMVCETCLEDNCNGHYQEQKKVIQVSNDCPVFCKEHNKCVRGFCITCSTVICGLCAVNTHSDHSIMLNAVDASFGDELPDISRLSIDDSRLANTTYHPRDVDDDNPPDMGNDDSLPGAVGGDSLPGAVGGDSLPGAVGGDCHRGRVRDESFPSAELIADEDIMGPCIVNGICFLPDGKLVLGSKRSFEVFKDRTDHKRTYCKMDVLCLSAHPTEQVIIIAGDGILQEWRYNGNNYQMTETSNITCRPVDVVALENERVVVLDKTSIYMYENKEQQYTYRLEVEEKVQIKAVCIDKSRRYIVGFTDKVLVQSQGGDWMSMFSSKDEHDFHLQDLCIDSMDNLFVCDIKNRAVLKFDKEGQFIGRVVKTDGIPLHIAIYQDKIMAVQVEKNNCNLIYKYRL